MEQIKAAVPIPNANYPGQQHEQMKVQVTQNYDPDSVTAVADVWNSFGTAFKELATDFQVLVNGSRSAWTGEAADGVRGALGKIGEFADRTGDGFTRTASAIEQQRDAAVQANKSMPNPVEFSPWKIAGDWLTNKGGFISPVMMVGAPIEMISTYNRQQGAKQEAVQVMQTRDATMMTAAQSMPTMESTPQVTNDQGVTQPSSTTSTTTSLSNANTNQRFSNTGLPGMPPPGTSNNTGNGTTNPSWVAPQVTNPNLPGNPNPGNPGLPGGYDPNRPGGNPNRPPGFPTPGPFPPGSTPPGRIPPGGSGQGRPPGSGQTGSGPGLRPGGPGGGGRGMGPGGIGGPGASGRGMGSFGPANPGGSAGVMGPGSGPTTPGTGATGRTGTTGTAGMGAGGAGAGQRGEEDKEHKTNYLVPTDEFFDDDRMVAPPVIGE